jgi:AraC-like DNA-binding protein
MSRARSIPRTAPTPALDRVVFESPLVKVAAFRCPPWHPRFSDSGPIQNDIFVFARRSVELCHEGGRPFVADPGVVTLYNRGQRYTRRSLGGAGDVCEWFAVEPGLLRRTLRDFDPAVIERLERPFRHTHAACSASVYLSQRALFERLLRAPAPEAGEIEEAVLQLLARVLAGVYGGRDVAARVSERQRAAAEHVKRLLAGRLGEPLRLADIARDVGLSVYHLCRSFRAATGRTLHGYRNELRLRGTLERLPSTRDLSRLALAQGYSSHSHFSGAFRRAFGGTPSGVRRALAGA